MALRVHMNNGEILDLDPAITPAQVSSAIAPAHVQSDAFYVNAQLADGRTLYTRPESISHFTTVP